MVSDQEIVNGVESLLRQSDPKAVNSINGYIHQLEAKLGLDLSHKATFIRDQIDLLLLRPNPQKDHFAPQYQHPPLLISPAHFQSPRHNQVLEFQCAAPQPKPDASAQIPVPEVPKESTPTGTKRRGGPGGLNKVCGVSPELQAIVGEPEMPRTQIVKELWAYIRKNKLQDPRNKRKIICNDELRLVFETDCTDMFKMNKLLAKHITALEPTKNSGADPKRLKAADVTPATESTEDALYAVVISDTLAKFFGTGEREMLQSEAVKRVWDYIKFNKLEDPLNSTVVQCDTKLQQLFGCNQFSAMGISEMLAHHLFRRS